MALRYAFRGKVLTAAALTAEPGYQRLAAPVFVHGPGLPDRTTVHVFETEAALATWAKGRAAGPLRAALPAIRSGIRRARAAEKGDHAALRRRQETLARRIADDLGALRAATGLAANSRALFLRATSKAAVLEGAVFDPAW
ncbi:MAG: hypothetical protein AB7O45_13965, partial [Alphaproteobacteria bacterium]